MCSAQLTQEKSLKLFLKNSFMFILTSISIMQQVQKNFNCILFSNHAHITMTKIMGKW